MSGSQRTGEQTELKQSLTLPLLVFYGTGTILGLGIYILLGKVAGEAGPLAAFSFLAASIIATFTGLSYGELSARIPRSAGEVNYVDEAFGKRALSQLVGWLIVVSAIVSTATVMNGYVGYVDVFVELPDWIVITVMTLILSGIAAWGINESATTITIITIIEIVGILLVILFSAQTLGDVPSRWRELIPSLSVADLEKVLLGAFLAFFAFIGFEDLVNVAEEAKRPKRDMLPAIVISLGVLTILYIIVAIIGTMALPANELAQSDAPLATILAERGEHYPKIISVISLVAIVNGVLVQIVMSARVLYGMAKRRMAPQIFGKVNPITRTPLVSTALSGGVVLALALAFDLKSLATATNFILIGVFVMVNAALIALKRRDPRPEGVPHLPSWVPVVGLVLSVGIFAFQAYASIRDATGGAVH